MTNKDALNSYTQYFVINYKGKESEKEYIYSFKNLKRIYICCTPEINTTL